MNFTTASFTRCWRSASLLAGLSLLSPACAYPQNIELRSAVIEAGDDGRRLAASYDIEFGSTLEEALRRGLSLPFRIEFEINRPRWYWFDEAIVRASAQRQLAYDPLMRKYRLTIGSLYHDFDSLDEAKRVLGAIRVVDLRWDRLTKGDWYEASVRMRLDVSRLPKPFQLNALSSGNWSLDSGWRRFTFTP